MNKRKSQAFKKMVRLEYETKYSSSWNVQENYDYKFPADKINFSRFAFSKRSFGEEDEIIDDEREWKPKPNDDNHIKSTTTTTKQRKREKLYHVYVSNVTVTYTTPTGICQSDFLLFLLFACICRLFSDSSSYAFNWKGIWNEQNKHLHAIFDLI